MKRFARQQPRGTRDSLPSATTTTYGHGRPRPQPPPLGLGIPASLCTPTCVGEALLPAITIRPLALRSPTSTGSHGSFSGSHTTPTFRLVPECSPSHIHHVAHKAGKNAAAILVAPDTDLADVDLAADPKPVELADGVGDDLFCHSSIGPPTRPDRLAVRARSPWSRSPRSRSPRSRSPERISSSARSSGATSDGQYITFTVMGRRSAFSTSTIGGYSVEPLSSPSSDEAYEIPPPIPPEALMWAGLEAARSTRQGMLNKDMTRGQPRRRSKSVPLPALPTTNGPVMPRQLSPSPSSNRLAPDAATPSRSAWSPRPWSQGPPPSPRPQRIFDVTRSVRPRSKTAPAASSGGDRGGRGNAGAGDGCDGAPHTTPPPPCPFATIAGPCRVSPPPPPLPPTERSFDGFVHQLEMLKLAGSIEPASPKFRRNAMQDSEQIPPQASDLAELEVDAAQHRKRHGHRRFNHPGHGHGHGHSHSHSRHLLHLRLPRFRRKGKSVP